MKMNFKKMLASTISLLTIMSTNSFVFSMDSAVSDANEIKEATSSVNQENENEIVKDKEDREIIIFKDDTNFTSKVSVPVGRANELLDLDNKVVNCAVCLNPIKVTDDCVLFNCKSIFYPKNNKNKDDKNKDPRDIFMSISRHTLHRDCAVNWYKQKSLCPFCKTFGKNSFYYPVFNGFNLNQNVVRPQSLRLKLTLYGSDKKVKFLRVPASLSFNFSPKFCSKCDQMLGKDEPFALYECSKKLFYEKGLTRKSYVDLLPHAVCLRCFRTNLNETDTYNDSYYDKDARFRCPQCEKQGKYKKFDDEGYGIEDDFATLVYPEQKASDFNVISLKKYLPERLPDLGKI